MVTVYTAMNCIACTATKTMLEKRGIAYRLEWLKESMEAMELAQAHGYTAAPIVVSGSLSWSGFRPDLIDKIEVIDNIEPIRIDIPYAND